VRYDELLGLEYDFLCGGRPVDPAKRDGSRNLNILYQFGGNYYKPDNHDHSQSFALEQTIVSSATFSARRGARLLLQVQQPWVRLTDSMVLRNQAAR
jgi:hypothetical protein